MSLNMQYQVPQFIEFEDKIVGPLTLRQFGYLAAGGALCFVFFMTLRQTFAIMLSVPVAALAMSLAFLKIKGMPLPKYLTALIGFSLRPQLYLWKRK